MDIYELTDTQRLFEIDFIEGNVKANNKLKMIDLQLLTKKIEEKKYAVCKILCYNSIGTGFFFQNNIKR